MWALALALALLAFCDCLCLWCFEYDSDGECGPLVSEPDADPSSDCAAAAPVGERPGFAAVAAAYKAGSRAR